MIRVYIAVGLLAIRVRRERGRPVDTYPARHRAGA